jgi:hypothetical protein
MCFAFCDGQRPVFNNMSLPPGVNLNPIGELWPLGGIFPPLFTPRGEYTLLFRRGEQRIFTSGGQLHPFGTNFPLMAKFTPGGQIWPLGLKFKTGLWSVVLWPELCPFAFAQTLPKVSSFAVCALFLGKGCRQPSFLPVSLVSHVVNNQIIKIPSNFNQINEA